MASAHAPGPGARTIGACIALTAVAGFALQAWSFWPGLMSVDSFAQYLQVEQGRYNDHHPPVMAWVWSRTDRVVRGPGGMLLLHLALLWGGLWCIAEGARRRGAALAWLLPLAGFLPFVANMAGVIWKDVAMAHALLCAAGLVYLSDTAAPAARRLALVAALILMAYATMVRANAAFAVLPIACYWIIAIRPRLGPVRAVAAGVVMVGCVLGLQKVVERNVLRAEPRHLSQTVMLFDLAGIACRGGHAEIPAPFRSDAYGDEALCRAYDPDHVDTLLYAPGHPLVLATDRGALRELRRRWLAGMRQEPSAYLAHRAHAFAGLLGLHPLPEHYRALRQSEIAPNPWGFVHTPTGLSKALDRTVDALADTGLLSGALWLAVSAALLCLGAARGSAPALRTALLASAVTYVVPYFFISLAPNYRYVYWSVLSTSVALILALSARARPSAK